MLDALLKSTNRPRLTALLTYHVVPGTMSAADLAAQVAAGRGRATLTTVQGTSLTVTDAGGGRLRIEDARGGRATVTMPDLNQSNGVLHVIDAVLMPR